MSELRRGISYAAPPPVAAASSRPAQPLNIRAAAVPAAGDGTVSAGTSSAQEFPASMGVVPQRDGDLLHLFTKYTRAAEGTAKHAALREVRGWCVSVQPAAAMHCAVG